MRLHLTDAMTVMAEAMTAVNASRRQVAGIAQWRDLTGAMDAARESAEQAMGTFTWSRSLLADVPGASTHRDWRHSAAAITTVLGSNMTEACRRSADAAHQAATARRQARQARDAREQALALATAATHYSERDAWLAEAEKAGRLAAEADERAEHQEHVGRECTQWFTAAEAARSYGLALARREDNIHVPVGEAIAAGGGQQWIAAGKQFLEETW